MMVAQWLTLGFGAGAIGVAFAGMLTGLDPNGPLGALFWLLSGVAVASGFVCIGMALAGVTP